MKLVRRCALVLLLGAAMARGAEAPEEPPARDVKAAEEPAAGKQAAEKATQPDGSVYVPPPRGKPRRRIGGAVRGRGDAHPRLYALVPEHTGQTVSAQPSLFWYLGGRPPEGSSLVFTLSDDAHVDPLVEAELPVPGGSGIQRIDLSQYGVVLERGTEYEWSVALVLDAQRRSNDRVAVGWIDRVEPPDALGSRPDALGYAAHGLWYDALAAAGDAAVRGALLREAGLEGALAAGDAAE